MADITDFQLTVDLELLNTLRFALSQLPGAAQRADEKIQVAIQAASEKANAPVDPPADPPLVPVVKTNGKHPPP